MMKKYLFTVLAIGCMAMMMVAGAENVSSFTKPANSTVIAEGEEIIDNTHIINGPFDIVIPA